MYSFGKAFATEGYTLRSGGADGADTSFEFGCDEVKGRKEIYIPWPRFNGRTEAILPPEKYTDALEVAAEIYGDRWTYLRSYVKLLMMRNIYQVLGYDLDTPSSFVLCWTPDGVRTASERARSTGGTGQAIACASLNQIPVFNLKNEGEEERLFDFLGGLK